MSLEYFGNIGNQDLNNDSDPEKEEREFQYIKMEIHIGKERLFNNARRGEDFSRIESDCRLLAEKFLRLLEDVSDYGKRAQRETTRPRAY